MRTIIKNEHVKKGLLLASHKDFNSFFFASDKQGKYAIKFEAENITKML